MSAHPGLAPAPETIAAVKFYCSRCGDRAAWIQMSSVACECGNSHNWAPVGNAAALVAQIQKAGVS